MVSVPTMPRREGAGSVTATAVPVLPLLEQLCHVLSPSENGPQQPCVGNSGFV